jgi:hypothetical protein
MDTVKIVDFRVEKTFRVHERWGQVSTMFDLFNLLNSAAITGVNTLTGPDFQKPTRTLEPRIARLAPVRAAWPAAPTAIAAVYERRKDSRGRGLMDALSGRQKY